MSAKPTLVSVPEKDKNPFLRDVEKTLNSGVSFGTYGFNLLTDNDLIGDSTVISYKKGSRCKNMDGQYILLEIPNDVPQNFFSGIISHDLKRTPAGILVVTMTPINKTTYPFTVGTSNNPGGTWNLNTDPTDPINWNEDTFRVYGTRVSGFICVCRFIVVVF